MSDNFLNTLAQLRNVLINKLNFNKGGSLSFYSVEEQTLHINTYPIDEKIVKHHKYINNGGDEVYLDDVFKILNTTSKLRSYDNFLHAKHFNNHYNSLKHNHYSINLNDDIKNNLQWCRECLAELNKHSDYFKVLKKCPECRKQFISVLKNGNENDKAKTINSLDFFFFKKMPTHFLFVPLPILSSPSIFIVLHPHKKMLDDEDKKTILDTISTTRETIYFYFYNRLINNLAKKESLILINNEPQLLKLYVDEICQCLIPLKYKIGNEDSKDYLKAKQWPTNNIESKLLLNLNNTKVEFNLTSYKIPVKKNGSYEKEWVHKTDGYSLRCEQVKIMLENIYQFVKVNWKNQRQAEKIALGDIYKRISKPLETIINTIKPISSTMYYIERQINPPYKSFLNLSKNEEVMKIFNDSAKMSYDNNTNGDEVIFNGIHAVNEPDEGFSIKSHKNFVVHLHFYLKKLIIDFPESNGETTQDILQILSEVYNKGSLDNGNSKRYLKKVFNYYYWLKLIAYDIADRTKQLHFTQLLVYISLGMRSGELGYWYASKEVKSDKAFNFKGQEGFNTFFNLDIWKQTIEDKLPKVLLSNSVTPAEFLGAIAELVGTELTTGPNRSVILNRVNIVSVNEEKNIAVTIECNGHFSKDSLDILLSDDDDGLYHGLRSNLKTICKTMDISIFRHKKESPANVDIEHYFYPFVVFSWNKNDKDKTTFRIVLGDFSNTWTCKAADLDKKKEATA